MNENGDRVHSEGEDSQEYAEFIRELLQVELDSNSDIKVIYPILKQRQHLLNARFAETLQQVAQRLIADENPETIELIVALIEKLSIHIKNFRLGSRANNIEIAITGYQIVLNNLEPGSEKFAQTKNNLANAYSNRINGFSEVALTVRTLEDFPFNNVLTWNNLGWAYLTKLDYINRDKSQDTNQRNPAVETVSTQTLVPAEGD